MRLDDRDALIVDASDLGDPISKFDYSGNIIEVRKIPESAFPYLVYIDGEEQRIPYKTEKAATSAIMDFMNSFG